MLWTIAWGGLLLIAGSASHRDMSSVEPLGQQVVGQQVVFDAGDGRWIAVTDPIELRFTTPIEPASQRVAVMIGDADWTGLFTSTATNLTYVAGPLRLPAGESPVAAYLVSPTNEWREIGRWTIRVLPPSWFEQRGLSPKMDVNNKGQVVESHRPLGNAPPRETFQDVTFSIGLRSQHARRGITASTQTNLFGVSNRPETLRFALEGNSAPKLDVADYLVNVDGARGKLALGHLSFSPHRHLIPAFASRGLSVSTRFWRTDLTAAALNSNTIVGFDNFFGVSRRDNRVGFVVVGTELLKNRAGGARIEASFIDGSRLPLSGFTQGQINDVEQGRGTGLRFVGSDTAQRLRVDAGFARSRFTNPSDGLLSQGFALVPVRERTDDAAYVDASYDVVKGARIGKATPLTLTGTYRFERVEPLYRSIGAPQPVRSDLLQHVAEITWSIGQVVAQASQTWSHDNLGKVASILRTDTGVTTATLLVPTASLIPQKPAAGASTPANGVSLQAGQAGTTAAAAQPGVAFTAWLPIVSYTANRSTQVGAGLPAGGGFISPSQVPDQVNTVHALRADWTMARWRFGYGLNHSLQDNRQEGRETSDLANLGHGVTIAVAPLPTIGVTGDIGFERATNKELLRVTRTRRIGLTGTWRITSRAAVDAILGRTALRDAATSRSDVTDVNLQYTHTVPLRPRASVKPRVQLFGRWNWQSADVIELLFGNNDNRRNWALSTGVTMTLF